jgi:hypothetical protein
MKRLAYRRRPRGAAWLEVRSGQGPDLAIALADLCEDGLGVRLTVPVRAGDDVEVVIFRAAGGPPARISAVVRWCAPAADGTYRAGLRLGRSLAPDEIAELAL